MSVGQKGSADPGVMLTSFLNKREKLWQELRSIEKQVYELETSYLQELSHVGKALKGFEGFMSSSKSTASVKRSRKIQPEDKVFSLSSRVKILLGDAKGFEFLHKEEKPVIYEDFKPSNILLSSDYNSKLSDIGLATDGSQGEDSNFTKSVMGTEGYAAPKYISTGQLTTMSDVFTFSVVLLELLTARKAVEKYLAQRGRNLVERARPMLKDPPSHFKALTATYVCVFLSLCSL